MWRMGSDLVRACVEEVYFETEGATCMEFCASTCGSSVFELSASKAQGASSKSPRKALVLTGNKLDTAGEVFALELLPKESNEAEELPMVEPHPEPVPGAEVHAPPPDMWKFEPEIVATPAASVAVPDDVPEPAPEVTTLCTNQEPRERRLEHRLRPPPLSHQRHEPRMHWNRHSPAPTPALTPGAATSPSSPSDVPLRPGPLPRMLAVQRSPAALPSPRQRAAMPRPVSGPIVCRAAALQPPETLEPIQAPMLSPELAQPVKGVPMLGRGSSEASSDGMSCMQGGHHVGRNSVPTLGTREVLQGALAPQLPQRHILQPPPPEVPSVGSDRDGHARRVASPMLRMLHPLPQCEADADCSAPGCAFDPAPRRPDPLPAQAPRRAATPLYLRMQRQFENREASHLDAEKEHRRIELSVNAVQAHVVQVARASRRPKKTAAKARRKRPKRLAPAAAVEATDTAGAGPRVGDEARMPNAHAEEVSTSHRHHAASPKPRTRKANAGRRRPAAQAAGIDAAARLVVL